MVRILAIVGIMLCAGVADAQTAGERAACRADVFRLCTSGAIASAALGDRRGIYECFKQHRHELSRACDRLLKAHGY